MLIVISYLLNKNKWLHKYNEVENVKEKKEKD